jgi:MoaA/NifB/PqqE/SkfB family radical SAM enzyme
MADIKREKIRRIAGWAQGNPQPPIRIDLEPTLNCNLKCKFCWQRSIERLKQCNYANPLSEERMLTLIDEAALYGVLEWQIAGGWEPMVKPRFCMQLLSKIKDRKMYGCLTTNGTLFQDEDIRHLARIGWDQILFSLEGPNEKVHDYLTGTQGSFKKSIKAMRLFKEYKKKLRTDAPVYSFHTVLTNKNYMHLKEMIKWGHELGTSGVCFEPINVWSSEGAKLKMSEYETKEFQGLISEALAVAKKLKVPTNLESLREAKLIDKKRMDEVMLKDAGQKSSRYPPLNAPCFNPWLNLEIRISGHAVPCRLCDSHQYASKLQSKTLKEIWLSSYFQRAREHMMNKKMPKYCKSCASGIVFDFRELRQEIRKSWLPRLINKITG